MSCDHRSRPTPTLAALALIGLAACQPVPRPFAPDAGAPANPLLVLDDRAGIVVLDVDGVPPAVARELPGATVAALHALNVPATTRSANASSRFLYAQAETTSVRRGVLEVKLVWELVGPKGAPIGRHVVTGTASDASWTAGSDDLIRRFAAASARGVAAFIQAPRPARAAPTASLGPLHVMPVAGVPGARGAVLRRAMADALRRLELTVAPVRRDRDRFVTGRVSLGPAAAGKRRLEVAWSVRGPGGAEIGNLKQANLIATDALGENWPELARLIADAAAPAVVEVLRRFRPMSESRPSETDRLQARGTLVLSARAAAGSGTRE